jgi:hypothetical protein
MYAASQPPAPPPQQTGAYYPQTPASGGPGYPPHTPAERNIYAPYPGGMHAANTQPASKSRGLLIGGIIGLVVLAAVIVIIVLMFGKQPGKHGGGSNAGSSVPSGGAVSQGSNEKPSPADANVKKDATLNDITGTWEGEMQITRMDGFDKLPADELPENFEEMAAEIMSKPAAMTLEIEEDGNWAFDADIATGMSFSSDDYDNGKYSESPLLLTGLKNGAFNVSYKEEIDEDGIKGTATMKFSGTVYKDSDGLYIEGKVQLTAQRDGVTINEEGRYKVTRNAPEETAEASAGSESGDEDQAVEDQAVNDTPDSEEPGISDLSTTERPDLGDFLWYLDSVYYEGQPDGTKPLASFSEIKGSWKALFYYDPDNIANAFGYEFLNVEFAGDAENVSMKLDWYMYTAESENYDRSGDEDTVLNGTLSGGGLSAGSPGYDISVTSFYELDGKQYGVGYLELQSGEPTYVALVRP